MQGLVTRMNTPLDALPRRCLKKPVNRSRRIQNDHRASRSSRTRRAVSICAETGLRLLQSLPQFCECWPLRDFLRSQLTDSPKATYRPSQRELSGHGGGYRVHYEAESSLTCFKHTFMSLTCQRQIECTTNVQAYPPKSHPGISGLSGPVPWRAVVSVPSRKSRATPPKLPRCELAEAVRKWR